MKKSTILGTIVGGIAFFLLGWLIYGFLLKDVMAESDDMGFMRTEENMVWWALVLSQFVWAYLLTWIFEAKNVSGAIPGLTTGLFLGLVISAAYDLGMYSMSNIYPDTRAMAMDIVINVIMTGLVGLIIGLVIGKSEAPAAKT